MLEDKVANNYNRALVEAEEHSLLQTTPEYRNLLKEYVDGSLLYEVSVRKVWDKAAKDTEGLQKYFEANRDSYKWSEPHAKGILVQCTNDSVAALIRARAAELGKDTLANTLRKEFRKVASFDRVLATKGTNQMVDNLLFGGPKVNSSNSKYQVYFMLDPKVLNEPEDVNDVKGLVTSDYQNEFQSAWEDELRRKYPVTVNEKVLKSVKKNSMASRPLTRITIIRLLGLAGLAAMASCGSGEQENTVADDDILVAVGDSTLRVADVVSRIPRGLDPADSTMMFHNIVDTWVRNLVLAEVAEKNIPDPERIEKMVEDYRNSIIVSEYLASMAERDSKDIAEQRSAITMPTIATSSC